MDRLAALTVFESLSAGPRLDVFRLLVRQAPDGQVAGEIASALGIPPSNLSFHLKALNHAGLVTVTAEGRFQRYRANLEVIPALIGFLSAECCGGRPELCTDPPPALADLPNSDCASRC